MKFKTLSVVMFAMLVTACQGKESPKVASLQKKDKALSCKEVMLEINEAEFYRKTAEKNKAPGVKTVLMPIGYISTYIDAEDAAGAANARVDYLNRIYEILECDSPQVARAQVPQMVPSTQGMPANIFSSAYPSGGGMVQPSGYAPVMVPMQQAPMMNQPMYHAPQVDNRWYW